MRSPAILALGAALIACGILVPSATWIATLLGGDSGPYPDPLLQGVALFRSGLVSLGSFAAIGGWQGWWAKGGDPPEPEPGFDYSLLALGGLLVAGLGMRAYRLDEGLWLDEVLTLINYVRLPFGELLTRFEDQNQHFLFSVLANLSVAAFGEHPWSLRLPATLFGVGGIWAVYALAEQVVPRREALLSALLLCVSYHHVWFSQNARGYSGVLFFALLSSALLLRGLEDRQPRTWLAYGLALALGGYTHLTMIFVGLAQLAILLASALRVREPIDATLWHPLTSGFLFASLFAVTLYGFGLPGFVEAELAASSVEGIETWRNPLWALQEALRSFQLDLGVGTLVGAAGLLVVALGSASFVRRAPAIVALLFVPAILIFLVGIATGHHLWPRTFFLLAGFAVMILVRGGLVSGELIARLLRRAEPTGARIGVAGVLIVCAVSAATVPLAYGPKQDFVGARQRIARELQPGDAVVTVGIAIFPYAELFAPEWASADTADALQHIRDAHARTWLVNIFPPYLADRHADLVDVIDADFALIEVFEGTLGGGGVYVYRADDAGPRRAASESGGIAR